MIIHCRNTLGDGTVLYVDYEVDDFVPPEDDTNATDDWREVDEPEQDSMEIEENA